MMKVVVMNNKNENENKNVLLKKKDMMVYE